jgi:Amino acid permease
VLGPVFAPVFGSAARAAAIGFMMLNMFHGTLQPLAGASRTLMQLAEDGLLPRMLALRSRVDVPWVATLLTALPAIAFLLAGDPTWLIAAANLAYLVGMGLPSVAVRLQRRDAPHLCARKVRRGAPFNLACLLRAPGAYPACSASNSLACRRSSWGSCCVIGCGPLRASPPIRPSSRGAVGGEGVAAPETDGSHAPGDGARRSRLPAGGRLRRPRAGRSCRGPRRHLPGCGPAHVSVGLVLPGMIAHAPEEVARGRSPGHRHTR